MQKSGSDFRFLISWLVFCLIALTLAAQTVVAAPKSTTKANVTANPKYAAIVIDAHSGKTLYQENANARRYPASLTKMMTLYLLFEAMQTGRIAPETPIPVSAYAAARPPTKIGFKEGQTIAAEAAAKALITRSANDVASAVAEYLGQTEPRFAKSMTAKARQLGMMNTHFANASGLPDNNNYSTARDMAILSLALREHFPQYYHLFNISSFSYRGQIINSHNRLVRNMKGVDGIKTGFIRASGFNVATSMRSEGKSLVAVVMGGRSAASRDEHMRSLLNRSLAKASKKKKSAPLVAKASPSPDLQPVQVALFNLPEGSHAPIPTIKRPSINKAQETQEETQIAAIEHIIEAEEVAIDTSLAFAAMAPKPVIPALKEMERLAAPLPKKTKKSAEQPKFEERLAHIAGNSNKNEMPKADEANPHFPTMTDREHDSLLLAALANEYPGSQPEILTMNAHFAESDLAAIAAGGALFDEDKDDEQEIDIFTTASISNGKKGWVIQIASTKTVREADIALYKALSIANERLDSAEPYLKLSETGDGSAERYYRARFAGFKSQKSALKTCEDLQSKAINCYVLKD